MITSPTCYHYTTKPGFNAHLPAMQAVDLAPMLKPCCRQTVPVQAAVGLPWQSLQTPEHCNCYCHAPGSPTQSSTHTQYTVILKRVQLFIKNPSQSHGVSQCYLTSDTGKHASTPARQNEPMYSVFCLSLILSQSNCSYNS